MVMVDDGWSVRRPFKECVFGLVLVFAFFVRILVSLHSYSGANTPPRFGDYEAQRHWMEITLHTNVQEWYSNTTHNDLQYWGLDYPPLTAYQSLLHGLFLHLIEPKSVELFTSRGYETASSKLLMRWTVLSSDALVFFPMAIYFVFAYYHERKSKEQAWALVMILLQPVLILIDHGHFQYNCISLGFVVGATAAAITGKDSLASVLYCLALNHKQHAYVCVHSQKGVAEGTTDMGQWMSAYYAPAFFAYLLGKCLKKRYPFWAVTKLGLVVISTFVACWWPFLSSRNAFVQVFSRLVPLQRGIFEDYVANFWCGTSPIFKWKRFPVTILSRLALGSTIVATLPSLLQQIKAPSRKGFLLAMLNSSLAFYLFSYQVHEKSILLPLLPASLLVLEEPHLFNWMVCCAMFSVFPLLRRDGLVVAFISVFILFNLLAWCGESDEAREQYKMPKMARRVMLFSFVFMLVVTIAYMIVKPGAKYPFIFEAIIMAFVFLNLILIALYTNIKQWPNSFQSWRLSLKEKTL